MLTHPTHGVSGGGGGLGGQQFKSPGNVMSCPENKKGNPKWGGVKVLGVKISKLRGMS